jgi:hypothetical protein
MDKREQDVRKSECLAVMVRILVEILPGAKASQHLTGLQCKNKRRTDLMEERK